jgi:hypothetical protein
MPTKEHVILAIQQITGQRGRNGLPCLMYRPSTATSITSSEPSRAPRRPQHLDPAQRDQRRRDPRTAM